jgi:pentatricopeptide repeat protein
MIYKHGLKPDHKIYHQLIIRYFYDGHLEMCLRLLSEMGSRNIIPTLLSVHSTIRLACDLGFARLATDIAMQFEQQGVRRLETETWMDCLSSCAEELYVIHRIFSVYPANIR